MQADAALSILQNQQRSAGDIDKLAALLNALVLHDFEGLVYFLYRVDVPEKEVRSILQQAPQEDAGRLLAALLLRRQAAKEQSRQQLRKDDTDIPEADRW
ncbi:hypothetical protein SAMN05444008_11077 [Cnuella takakiae]|uniref:Uncharacterized protein n=1 Tax=Cnuella takakiae TaxID=1302690 RepID=A0A1M5D4U9_9BACT|nr:hypothetical protein [Cnuella takakiae]OLY94105.1 hypothetical protein BUE76_21090 [Cnuella takakiae]SHF61991.1 hypothetical protein SAMN05444008_11077 [Cnuella takakiae]